MGEGAKYSEPKRNFVWKPSDAGGIVEMIERDGRVQTQHAKQLLAKKEQLQETSAVEGQ